MQRAHGFAVEAWGVTAQSSISSDMFFISFVCGSPRSAARTTHTAQGSRPVHLQGATAERCIMVMCPLGDRGFEGSGTNPKATTYLINADLVWEPWAYGCLEARRKERAIMLQQRCEWSAEKTELTSALRLHDVPVAVPRASKSSGAWAGAPRKPKKQFFDQRISHAVVNIADEEGEIDLLGGSGMRQCDFCAPCISVKATCNAFTPALERLEEL